MAFLSDALGSTLALTDSSGAINTSYTYEPFGKSTVAGTNANPYQFTGRENDGTGLYFYRARYYSPTYQRFIGQDPIGFRGGDWNLYAYVLNSPVSLVDPFGYQWRPTPTPAPTPSLDQVLRDAANPLDLFNANTPSGGPAISCAPPPPVPALCAGGPIGAEGMGLLAGSGFVGGYLAYGPVGSAILGSITSVAAAWLAAQCGEE
ncbi:MAG TPA: RHS repeat-associated core domain-containing protein [Candidatus Binataceae bacterium]|nr:RHS repeat-associated core domain-containing protein [Candidatus Binataceae bacterium]